ncbi:Na/Pi symporter [Haloferula chungangensis]|uniref:Na/Pi symporter n=1 Tax=Haloferula chungangensis TaxID=1048331 RepID=A0ABW2L556_9BACT
MNHSNTATLKEAAVSDQDSIRKWMNWVGVALLVYLLLIAVSMIGSGFKAATGDSAKELFAFANNPFTGLVIGTVATALIQSSSTVTSIIVGLVAGGMPVGIAVPMIMGANVGTSVTNTLVSLGHVRNGEEFRRAFAAATIHDFFNVLSVVIFLPLEIMFHPLQKLAGWAAGFLVGGDSMSMKGLDFIKPITKPVVGGVESGLASFLPEKIAAIGLIVIGIVLIFLVVTFIGKLLKSLMVGRAKAILHSAVGRGPISGIGIGAIITILVQSSSTTTSLIVPLAGNGLFTLRQVYPFTLGANIGTCVTAMLAATAVSGANSVFALQIAFVHLIYNVLGVIVIYGIPFLRKLPLFAASTLADAAVRNKFVAIGYIVGVFFLLPGLLIFVSHQFGI